MDSVKNQGVFIVGDMHVEITQYAFRGRIVEMMQKIKEHECKSVICLGDFFNSWLLNNDSLQMFSYYIKMMSRVVDHISFIQGNHELPKTKEFTPIFEVMHTLFPQMSTTLTWHTTPSSTFSHPNHNLYIIPFSKELDYNFLEKQVKGRIVLGHFDIKQIRRIRKMSPKYIISGHYHTPQKFKGGMILGSYVPIEFDRDYEGKNYYAVIKPDNKIKIRSFEHQIQQKIVEVNDNDDVKDLLKEQKKQKKREKRTPRELVKVIVTSKSVSHDALSRLLSENGCSRIEFDTSAEIFPEGTIQELYEKFLVDKDLLMKVNPGLYSAVISSLEQYVDPDENDDD